MVKTNRAWLKLTVLLSVILFSYYFVSSANTIFGASWDSDTISTEETPWKNEIERWNTLSSAWERTWEQKHSELYPGMIDGIDIRSYCNERGCWESDMFSFTYTSPDGIVSVVNRGSSDADWKYAGGGSWSSVNGGQSLMFSDADGATWESSNFGQVLAYKDARENSWGSSNFGQVITFMGIDGTSWESSNFGQVLSNTDNEGNTSSDINFGQVGSFTDTDGEGWEVFDTR